MTNVPQYTDVKRSKKFKYQCSLFSSYFAGYFYEELDKRSNSDSAETLERSLAGLFLKDRVTQSTSTIAPNFEIFSASQRLVACSSLFAAERDNSPKRALVVASIRIFEIFEYQFMKITDEDIKQVAYDAAQRAMKYIVNQSSDNQTIIVRKLIKGVLPSEKTNESYEAATYSGNKWNMDRLYHSGIFGTGGSMNDFSDCDPSEIDARLRYSLQKESGTMEEVGWPYHTGVASKELMAEIYREVIKCCEERDWKLPVDNMAPFKLDIVDHTAAMKRSTAATTSTRDKAESGKSAEKLSKNFPPTANEFHADLMETTQVQKFDNDEFLQAYVFGDGENKFTIFVGTMNLLLSEGHLPEADLSLPENHLPNLRGKSPNEIEDIIANSVGEHHTNVVEALIRNGIEFTVSPVTRYIFVKNCDWSTLFKISNLVNELRCDLTLSGGGCCKYLGGPSSWESGSGPNTAKFDESQSVQADAIPVKICVVDSGCSLETVDRIMMEGNVSMHSQMIDATTSAGTFDVDYRDDYSDVKNGVRYERHGSGVVEIIARLVPSRTAKIFVINIGNGRMSNVVNAMIKIRDLNMDVVNCSFYVDEYSAHFSNTLRIIQSDKIVVVAAATNRNFRKINYLNNKLTIMVGSHDQQDMVSGYTEHQCLVDVCCPAERVHMNSVEPNLRNGTSFATPVVTAAVAHVLYIRKNRPSEGILKGYLKRTAGELTCGCPRHGGSNVRLKFDRYYFLKIATRKCDDVTVEISV